MSSLRYEGEPSLRFSANGDLHNMTTVLAGYRKRMMAVIIVIYAIKSKTGMPKSREGPPDLS